MGRFEHGVRYFINFFNVEVRAADWTSVEGTSYEISTMKYLLLSTNHITEVLYI